MKLPVNYNKINFKERKLAREQYIEAQQGLCCHCNIFLHNPPPDTILDMGVNKRLFPKNFFKWPVHLHHNHKTGMTIGAVHHYCNAVLWQHHGE